MAKSYYEKLRDPRWQKKRLRIMERAEFSCEECCDKEKTLNVHHGYYEKGRDPWEYPDESLWCLCEDCHEIVQKHLTEIKYELSFFRPADLSTLPDLIRELRNTFYQTYPKNEGHLLFSRIYRKIFYGHKSPWNDKKSKVA